MQGDRGLRLPHGPWTICSATNEYPNGSEAGSGISALMKESIN
jgi:hypothetical protein